MSFFDLFKRPNIDQGVAEYKSVPGAVLLDVRTAEEYREGHIPDSKNVSLQAIGKVQTVVQEKDPPCLCTATPVHAVHRQRQCSGKWDTPM